MKTKARTKRFLWIYQLRVVGNNAYTRTRTRTAANAYIDPKTQANPPIMLNSIPKRQILLVLLRPHLFTEIRG